MSFEIQSSSAFCAVSSGDKVIWGLFYEDWFSVMYKLIWVQMKNDSISISLYSYNELGFDV